MTGVEPSVPPSGTGCVERDAGGPQPAGCATAHSVRHASCHRARSRWHRSIGQYLSTDRERVAARGALGRPAAASAGGRVGVLARVAGRVGWLQTCVVGPDQGRSARRGPRDDAVIRTPDRRLRVCVRSTLGELAEERRAVSRAVSALRLTPVMFEAGARPYPPAVGYPQPAGQHLSLPGPPRSQRLLEQGLLTGVTGCRLAWWGLIRGDR